MSNPNWVPTPPGRSPVQDFGNADTSSTMMGPPPDEQPLPLAGLALLENTPTPDNPAASSSSAPPPHNELPLPLLPAPVIPEQHSFFNQFPPGYRFCPNESELLSYLRQKILKQPIPTDKIQDTNIYRCNPYSLTELFKKYGEDDNWYFFTSRDKRYKNGSRPNRETEDKVGFWKATGKDAEYRNKAGVLIGKRKSLAYIKGQGKNKTGLVKTRWLMHEYVLTNKPVLTNADTPSSSSSNPSHIGNMELDEVVCRIYKKKPGKGKGKADGEDSEIIAEAEEEEEEEKQGAADSTQQIEEHSSPLNSENQILQQAQNLVESSSMQEQWNVIIQPDKNALENQLYMPQQQQHMRSSFHHNLQHQTTFQQNQNHSQNQLNYELYMMQEQERSLISSSGNRNESSQFNMPQQWQNHPHLLYPGNNHMVQLEQDPLDYQPSWLFSHVNDNHYFPNNTMQQQAGTGTGPSASRVNNNQHNVSLSSNVHFGNVSPVPLNSFNSTDLGHVYGCRCLDCFSMSSCTDPAPFNYYDNFLSYSTASGNTFVGAAAPGSWVSNAAQPDQVVIKGKRKRDDGNMNGQSDAGMFYQGHHHHQNKK